MKKMLAGMVAALVIAVTPALAEFPDKDLQGIIQWGAGGSTDIIMRAVSARSPPGS